MDSAPAGIEKKKLSRLRAIGYGTDLRYRYRPRGRHRIEQVENAPVGIESYDPIVQQNHTGSVGTDGDCPDRGGPNLRGKQQAIDGRSVAGADLELPSLAVGDPYLTAGTASHRIDERGIGREQIHRHTHRPHQAFRPAQTQIYQYDTPVIDKQHFTTKIRGYGAFLYRGRIGIDDPKDVIGKRLKRDATVDIAGNRRHRGAINRNATTNVKSRTKLDKKVPTAHDEAILSDDFDRSRINRLSDTRQVRQNHGIEHIRGLRNVGVRKTRQHTEYHHKNKPYRVEFTGI